MDTNRELAALAFALSEKRLDRQEARLEELRARTGVLLAASSLSVSFFGREVFRQSGLDPLAAVSIGAFLVSMAASVYVLLPRDALVFAVGGSAVYEALYQAQGGIGEGHRQLAYDLDDFCDTNDRQIDRLIRGFELSAGALVVELLALVVLLARTIA